MGVGLVRKANTGIGVKIFLYFLVIGSFLVIAENLYDSYLIFKYLRGEITCGELQARYPKTKGIHHYYHPKPCEKPYRELFSNLLIAFFAGGTGGILVLLLRRDNEGD